MPAWHAVQLVLGKYIRMYKIDVVGNSHMHGHGDFLFCRGSFYFPSPTNMIMNHSRPLGTPFHHYGVIDWKTKLSSLATY